MKHISSSEQNKTLKVVIGNESSDLDSNIGAIVLSYLLSLKSNKSIDYSPQNIDNMYIPLISQNEEFYFETKHELIHQFNLFGITEEDLREYLIFMRSVKNKLINQLKSNTIEVILFDHNEVDVDELKMNKNWQVKYIYDHHHFKREPQVPHTIVTPLGSCTTLVVEEFKKMYEDERFKNDPFLSTDLLKFLYGPIVFDTKGFKKGDENKVWVKRDQRAMDFIKQHTTIDSEEMKFIAKYPENTILPKSKEMTMQHHVMRDFKAFDQMWKGTKVKIAIVSWHNTFHERFFNFYTEDQDSMIETQRELEEMRKLDLMILKSGQFIIFISDSNTELLKKVSHKFFTWPDKHQREQHVVNDDKLAYQMQAMTGVPVKRKMIIETLNHMFPDQVETQHVDTGNQKTDL